MSDMVSLPAMRPSRRRFGRDMMMDVDDKAAIKTFHTIRVGGSQCTIEGVPRDIYRGSKIIRNNDEDIEKADCNLEGAMSR